MILPWTPDSSLCHETNEYANTSSVEYQVFVISADCISGERTETKVQRLAKKKQISQKRRKRAWGRMANNFLLRVQLSFVQRKSFLSNMRWNLVCTLFEIIDRLTSSDDNTLRESSNEKRCLIGLFSHPLTRHLRLAEIKSWTFSRK